MTATFFKSLILLQLGTFPFAVQKTHTQALWVRTVSLLQQGPHAVGPAVLLPAAAFLNPQKRLFFPIGAFRAKSALRENSRPELTLHKHDCCKLQPRKRHMS